MKIQSYLLVNMYSNLPRNYIKAFFLATNLPTLEKKKLKKKKNIRCNVSGYSSVQATEEQEHTLEKLLYFS